MINIIIVDDHKLIRDAIKIYINRYSDFYLVGEAVNGLEALDLVKNNDVDIVLLDISMEEMNGVECAKELNENYPNVKFIILTMYEETEYIKQMLKYGASGYLLKNSPEDKIVEAILAVSKGKTYFDKDVLEVVIKSFSEGFGDDDEQEKMIPLTNRELEVLDLVVKEYTNGEIAEKLFISPRTVDAHKRSLLEKTNSKNIVGLVKYAIHNKLASPK